MDRGRGSGRRRGRRQLNSVTRRPGGETAQPPSPRSRERVRVIRDRRCDERGFSVMEAIIGAVIAILAIVGLAYTFSVGRGSIDRFSVARAADAKAVARMEWLTSLPPDTSAFTMITPLPFVFAGRTIGTERWDVTAAPGGTPGSAALRQVAVTVAWTWASIRDSVRYVRLFPQ